MKNVIEGWYHKPGNHCASTAIRDAMRFWGHGISEAFCFGLGRGLGAFYLVAESFSPSRWLMTRTGNLEKNFFDALNIPFAFKTAPDAGQAWLETKADIDAGIPVLLHTDLFYLGYYNTRTHFNRHSVLLWGYDEEALVAYLSDTGWEGLMEVTMESLASARSSNSPPGQVWFDWFPIRPPEELGDLKQAALQSLKMNALEMSHRPGLLSPNFGLMALKTVAGDLPNWGKAGDWAWSARFTYQIIEKRGTGGSAFRKMYTGFIEEVEEMAPEIRPLGLSRQMAEIASKWSEFAAKLKSISELEEPSGFDEAAKLAMDLFDMESEFYKIVLDNIS